MNTYQYEVSLKVQVDAFTQFDAEDMIRDALGLGDAMGVEIIESSVGEFEVV